MALGNWVCMTWNGFGHSVEGKFQHNNIMIEAYKDWLYIHNAEEWDQMEKQYARYSRPIVKEIKRATTEVYNGIQIVTHRVEGTQSALFFIIQSQATNNCLIGIVCYGYKGDEWVGVLPMIQELFHAWYQYARLDTVYGFSELPAVLEENKGYNQGDWFILKEVVKHNVMEKAAEIIEETLEAKPVLCCLCGEPLTEVEIKSRLYLHLSISPPFLLKPSASGHVHTECGLEPFPELRKELEHRESTTENLPPVTE